MILCLSLVLVVAFDEVLAFMELLEFDELLLLLFVFVDETGVLP